VARISNRSLFSVVYKTLKLANALGLIKKKILTIMASRTLSNAGAIVDAAIAVGMFAHEMERG